MKIFNKVILNLGLFIFCLMFVNANGCCFDSSSGLCSMNTPANSCSTVWSPGASCNGRSECVQGCCVLGSATMYTTQRTCELESRAKGFEQQWDSDISKEQCSSMAGGTEMVACVYPGEYENQCRYIERKSCTGTIYEGKICSDPSLNTTCTKTSKTKCFEDDGVYFIDSCGNRDVLSQQCNYEAGTTCRPKNSNEAYCKDLNCVDKFGNARINGESWCIGLGGNITMDDVRNVEFKKASEKPEGFQDHVGTRFFKQVCIDGEVINEPCADYRNEVCVPGNESGAQCIANPWADCLAAGNNSEECGSEFCFMTRLDDCVSFGVEGHTNVCGEDRTDWEGYASENGLSTEGVSEVTSELLDELNLPICAPKVTGGSELSATVISSSEEGVCSPGNYEGNVWMQHSDFNNQNRWWVRTNAAYNTLVDVIEGKFGNIGLISLNIEHWRTNAGESNRLGTSIDLAEYCTRSYWGFAECVCIVDNPLVKGGGWWCHGGSHGDTNRAVTRSLISAGTIPDSGVIELLNERTIAIGDCAGKSNWAGAEGSATNSYETTVSKATADNTMLFSFLYESKDWGAPSSGDCSLCGADGLPCSEYRCEALGTRCEYKEPRGIDTGVCVSSDDLTPPPIGHSQIPPSPVPPFSSVKITLTTGEDSYCKFDFSSTEGQMANMKYETSGNFARTHEFILSVPGRAIDDEDINEYPLLTRDGKYQLFVRCEDGAGNYNINPYIINLVVDDTPDRVSPSILEYFPKTNSFVEFNKTTKQIRFQINEPAECRWSPSDKPFNVMENEFVCDSLPTEQSMAKGYFCSGTLENITTEIELSTKYYIRCKDQLILEGKETEIYKRNANDRSFEYILKPSLALEISEVYPPYGDFIVGGVVGNITFTAKTRYGSERGKAECKWRVKIGGIGTGWQLFDKTDSSSHETILTTLKSEEYFIEVLCSDSAGNKANISSQLNILVDTIPPTIARVYNDKGNVKLVLNEPAVCKVTTRGSCSNVVTNGTSMSNDPGRTEFTTNLLKGTRYFIRCEDDFGNARCFENIIFH